MPCRRRWRPRWPTARSRAFGADSASASPASPARAAGPRRSRSGRSACAWPSAASGSSAPCSCPAAARWCASGRRPSRCTCCVACCCVSAQRLFVALELPARRRGGAGGVPGRGGRGRVAARARRGAAPDARVPRRAARGGRRAGRPVLEAAAGPAPPLRLGPALLLPPRRARVLCATVEDLDGELAALQGRVSAGLASAGRVRAGDPRRSARTRRWPACAPALGRRGRRDAGPEPRLLRGRGA